MRFVAAQAMVQDLDRVTSGSIAMQAATLIHTQILVTTTLFQVEYKTDKQSWLELTTSHLMSWRYSILVESRVVFFKTKL